MILTDVGVPRTRHFCPTISNPAATRPTVVSGNAAPQPCTSLCMVLLAHPLQAPIPRAPLSATPAGKFPSQDNKETWLTILNAKFLKSPKQNQSPRTSP